jgi:signal transduction histidine kinase
MNIRGWPGRHPWVVDCVVTALAFGVSMVALDGREDVSGVQARTGELIATIAVCVPLLWRRRAPVLVFMCTAAFSWLIDSAGTDVPAGLFGPLFALYAVARYRPRRWLWPVVAVFAGSALANLLMHDMLPQDITAMFALLAAVVFLGMNLRTRRAYLDQLEERAARLERERDQQAQLATAAERARIARELHDIVAHNLVVMVALADGAAATAPTAPDRAADAMTKVAATGRLALVEMRRMVGVLKTDDPPPTDGSRGPQPGLDDVDPLIERVRAAGMRVELTRSGEPGAWGPGAGLAVYRIVQEALTNALKHAGPRAVTRVRLCYTADGADIEVIDDGAGRPASTTVAADRHGLAGMAERAASFGGTLEAGPGAAAGWRVRTQLRFETEGP